MLSTRCKHFRDDSSVMETCLEGSSCPYIHPSHPQGEKSAPHNSDRDTGVKKTTFRKAYQKMISYTEHAVRIQIELDTAKENLSRWKRTRSSKIYAHAGPSTRRFLDTQRKNYGQNVSNLEKQLSCTLSKLSCGHMFGAFISEENKLKLYINELNQWVESLRHLIPQPLPLGTSSEDPSKWTWGQIHASVVTLNDICEKFAELSLMKRHTNEIDDDRGKADQLVRDARAKEMLKQQIERDEEELVSLLTKLRDLEDLQSQMQKKLETYAQWAQEDAAKIRALSERVELLYMLPCPAVQPPDNILEATSKFVTKESESIVVGYFHTLVSLCIQSSNGLLEELDVGVLQSMKQLTESIYERAIGAEASNSEVK